MKKLFYLLFCLSILSFSACENVFDCIIEKSPELPEKTFKPGVIDQLYYDAFDADIMNEPRDDDYDYYYYLDGDLPDGLDIIFNHRTVSILGTPEIEGTYRFTLYLEVLPPLNYDEFGIEYQEDMCSLSTSKSYFIRIE